MGKSDAEFLLINNNNTRTKFALASREEILGHTAMLSREVTSKKVRDLLTSWSWESVVLASVVPSLVEPLSDAMGNSPLITVSASIELGLQVDFPDPTSVGADRLANAVAAADCYPGDPVVVVDFGTALTFDFVDSRPAYVGGVIAPGLDAMRHYLHQRTALLPEIEIEKPASPIGKSTIEAMQSGAFHGYRGLVREILSQTRNEFATAPKVIATGGYAALLADDFPEIERVDPYLTMDGLLRIARLNFSS